MSDEYVRHLSRLSRRHLADMIYEWAAKHGHRWVLGGPDQWSKDELVNACLRIAEGREP